MLVVVILLLSACSVVQCVDRNKFKTCEKSGFCRRTRALLPAGASEAPAALWQVRAASASVDASQRLFELQLEPTSAAAASLAGDSPRLSLVVTSFANGAFRVLVDELDARRPRFRLHDVLLDGVVERSAVPFGSVNRSADGNSYVLTSAIGAQSAVEVTLAPFRVALLVNGSQAAVLNARSLFHVEHMRAPPLAPAPPAPPPVDAADAAQAYEAHARKADDAALDTPIQHEERIDDDGDEDHEGSVPPAASSPPPPAEQTPAERDGWWQESFDGQRDSKRDGPNALSVDITFPRTEHVFGIPGEHCVRVLLCNVFVFCFCFERCTCNFSSRQSTLLHSISNQRAAPMRPTTTLIRTDFTIWYASTLIYRGKKI